MQKMKSRKGFTLIEMLIVVGIIAVLVAVSIPMVNSSLDRAKRATDAANERAAKAAAMIEYLNNNKAGNYVYDATTGGLGTSASTGYGQCSDHKGQFILLTVSDDGKVDMKWNETATTTDVTNPNGEGLDSTKLIKGESAGS